MKAFSKATTTVTNSPIRKMFNLAVGMKDVVSFTVGEPDFNTPDNIVEAAVTALRNGAHHYTQNAGILPLREAVADKFERTLGLRYDPQSEVMITSGGMEALFLAMRVLLDSGDEFILPDPSYTNYSRMVYLCDAEPVFVKCTPENGFAYDPKDLEAAITPKTKGFVVNSPANPTGGTTGLETLKALAEIAKKHDLWVLSDEVYDQLVYEGEKPVSIATLPGMRERTLVINSFSKAYAMTGWRVGYCAGPKELVQNMIMFQENVCACVNTAAQYAAIEALTGPQDKVEEMRKVFAERRAYVVDAFSRIEGLRCYAPKGAFYAFIDITSTGLTSEEFAKQLLQEERVIVVPGIAFGTYGDQFIRLCFATAMDNIQEGIKRIAHFMAKRKA